jgi:hypothetical protein
MTRMVKQKQNWERNMEKDVLEVDEWGRVVWICLLDSCFDCYFSKHGHSIPRLCFNHLKPSGQYTYHLP